MSTQGPLPSPTSELDFTAKGYGKKCFRYIILSPGEKIMCRDKTRQNRRNNGGGNVTDWQLYKERERCLDDEIPPCLNLCFKRIDIG